ncbi:sushi, nidogen and EGF-like domain-containing protein 1, partial [Seriola lalandi dorsalis]|uniref:sushi, nidogen and EGF-like domain-containing protein 1 n=1 Tax=Seriola lalandi dorsalis TaxID=1841481 RepID=UPI000C6F7479
MAMEKGFWLAARRFWQTILFLRMEKQGLAQAVFSRGGELLTRTGDNTGRWKEHFQELLNPTTMSCTVNPQATSTVTPQTPRPLYPISGTTSSRSDDGSSPQIVLQRPFVYFGRSYNHIYVNHNGHLTFNASWSRYIPLQFPLHGSRDIIAPFWTDLDNRGNGQVIYNQYTNGNVLQQATQDINAYFPGLHFNANWVFVATWYQVAYYPVTNTQTTIQAVLISGGRYSFVLMNYGILAATTRNIQAGYDT